MALVKRGYAETSDIKSTIAGHMLSVKNDNLPVENGTPWKLGDLKEANEIYNITKPEAGDEIVLAHSVLYPYDTSTTLKQHEMYLRKEAGEPARAYEIVSKDRFAIADYMITPLSSANGVQTGNYIVVDTTVGHTTPWIEVSSKPTTYGFIARIDSLDYKSNLTLVRLTVIQNEAIAAADDTDSE